MSSLQAKYTLDIHKGLTVFSTAAGKYVGWTMCNQPATETGNLT